MPIVDLPFVYAMEVVPPRKRKPVVVSAVENMRVDIPEHASGDLETFSLGKFAGWRIDGKCHLPWRDPVWGLRHAVLREGRILVEGVDAAGLANDPDRVGRDLWGLVSFDAYDHATKDLWLAGRVGVLPVEADFANVLRSNRQERLAQAVRLTGDLALVDGVVTSSRMRLIHARTRTREGVHLEDAARWFLPDAVLRSYSGISDARWSGSGNIRGRYDPEPYPDLARGVLEVHREILDAIGSSDLSNCGDEIRELDDLVSDLHSGRTHPEDARLIVPVVESCVKAVSSRSGFATYRVESIDLARRYVSNVAAKRRETGSSATFDLPCR